MGYRRHRGHGRAHELLQLGVAAAGLHALDELHQGCPGPRLEASHDQWPGGVPQLAGQRDWRNPDVPNAVARGQHASGVVRVLVQPAVFRGNLVELQPRACERGYPDARRNPRHALEDEPHAWPSDGHRDLRQQRRVGGRSPRDDQRSRFEHAVLRRDRVLRVHRSPAGNVHCYGRKRGLPGRRGRAHRRTRADDQAGFRSGRRFGPDHTQRRG